MALSLFALAPIVFWRLLSDKVIYYGSLNTFTVLCIAMGVIIVFEAIFSYLRSFLVLFMTARVDVRLSEYLMDQVLKLPIDYFERTQVGIIGRDMNEIWRVRTFLTGQLFGTVLDSLTLFVFLPVMFFFSPSLTLIVLTICGLIVGWLLLMLPHYRKRSSAVLHAEGERGAFLFQTLHGIRTVKSLSLEDRQRRQWDVHVARIAKLKLAEGYMSAIMRWASTSRSPPTIRSTPAYYRVRVTVTAIKLIDVPSTFRLIPGMTLIADVKVGTRALGAYLIGGMIRGLGQAMREP